MATTRSTLADRVAVVAQRGLQLSALATALLLAVAVTAAFGVWPGILAFVLLVVVASMLWPAARWAQRTNRGRLEAIDALEERDRFFDVSKDMLVTASAAGTFVRVNPAWTTTLGYRADELCSRPFFDFIHPDDIEPTIRELDRQVADGQSVFNFQNRYRHLDGSYRWLEWSSSPSADGAWLYAVARDVTERKLEEERLHAPAMALARRQVESIDRIQAIIDAGAFMPVYQPIVDLATGDAVGFEALTRFADGSRPDQLFATALECGLGIALEQVTLSASVRGAKQLPRGAWLSVNVSPPLLMDVEAMRAALGLRVRPLVLEITEHESIDSYAAVRDALHALGRDMRLAVDDAGAGVANFNHLVELKPNFVKIDASMVRGVDHDVSRQAVVAGILHFAAAAGCQVIAEGIETDAELATVSELGVGLGQGYLLGRPAPADTWVGHVTSAAAIQRHSGRGSRRTSRRTG